MSSLPSAADQASVVAALEAAASAERAPTAAPVRAATPVPEHRAIRVSPEKIDRLLDLVGESLLHRRRLEHALEHDRSDESRRLADELHGHGFPLNGQRLPLNVSQPDGSPRW